MGFWLFLTKSKLLRKSKKQNSPTQQGRSTQQTEVRVLQKRSHGDFSSTSVKHGPASSSESTNKTNFRAHERTDLPVSAPPGRPTRPESKADVLILSSSEQPILGTLTPDHGDHFISRKASQRDKRPVTMQTAAPHKENGDIVSPTLGRTTRNMETTLQDQAQELPKRASPIPIPKRSISYSEGTMRRASKRKQAESNRQEHLKRSNISLPISESLSDMSAVCDQGTVTIKVLDVLSPRPTIRYGSSPRHAASRSMGSPQSFARPDSNETNEKGKAAISNSKRINELADGLDAQALRELMERDQRRRERKQRNGLAIQAQQATPTTTSQQEEHETDKDEVDRGRQPRTVGLKRHDVPHSMSSSTRPSSPPIKPLTGDSRNEGGSDNGLAPNVKPATSRARRLGRFRYSRQSQAGFTPPLSPQHPDINRASMSQLHELASDDGDGTAGRAELDRRSSEQVNSQIGSWASVFKRSGTRRKSTAFEAYKSPPGSSPNMSRYSLPPNRETQHVPQVSAPGTSQKFRRSTPSHRTQSRFVEDLPDFPPSPPDSRVHSPETDNASSDAGPILDATKTSTTMGQSNKVVGIGPVELHPSSPPPTTVLSHSLASVDSEASWLSGKPGKRSSTHRDSIRRSQSSLHAHHATLDPDGGTNVANDPYFSFFDPVLDERRESSARSGARKASSSVLVSDAESPRKSDASASLAAIAAAAAAGSGGTATPSALRAIDQCKPSSDVRHSLPAYSRGRAKSSEALSKHEQPRHNDGDDVKVNRRDADPHTWLGDESPTSEYSEPQASAAPLVRAHTVNYGTSKHARRISAGSAKLLSLHNGSAVESNGISLPRAKRYSVPAKPG